MFKESDSAGVKPTISCELRVFAVSMRGRKPWTRWTVVSVSVSQLEVAEIQTGTKKKESENEVTVHANNIGVVFVVAT